MSFECRIRINTVKALAVTFHGKTYINAFPLNAVELTPNERRANDFWERLNDLVNALNVQVKISNGFRKRLLIVYRTELRK